MVTAGLSYMSTCLLFCDDAVFFTPRFNCFTEYTSCVQLLNYFILKIKAVLMHNRCDRVTISKFVKLKNIHAGHVTVFAGEY